MVKRKPPELVDRKKQSGLSLRDVQEALVALDDLPSPGAPQAAATPQPPQPPQPYPDRGAKGVKEGQGWAKRDPPGGVGV